MKEKRVKKAVVRARVSDDIDIALRAYCKEHNLTVTKIIEDFLEELLKDKIKRD